MSKYRISEALMNVYKLFWDEFSSWYLEIIKPAYQQPIDTVTYQATLNFFEKLVILLHPFMPFITEELYQSIPHRGEALMLRRWPRFGSKFRFPAQADEMKRIMAAITAIRTRRSEMNVPPSKKASVYIESEYSETFEHGRAFIERLASAASVEINTGFDHPDAVVIISDGAKILIPLDELVDREKELERMKNELEKCEQEVSLLEGRLSNQAFVSKAPAQIIEAERAKLAKAVERRDLARQGMEKYS
jgi:valyl-tRNA synthetase